MANILMVINSNEGNKTSAVFPKTIDQVGLECRVECGGVEFEYRLVIVRLLYAY